MTDEASGGDGRPDDRSAIAGDGSDHAGSDDTADGDATSAPARHDRIERHATPGAANSLFRWPDAKHPVRVVLNVCVVWLIRYSPSLRLKNWLLRRLGADVGAGVAFALTATPDVFWPELLTVEDHAIVGYDATLLCHAFLQNEYRTGEVVVGERATIGAGAVVLPGVAVGAGASVGANAVVTRDVPPGTTVAGAPATPVGERTGGTSGEEADNEVSDAGNERPGDD